MIKLTTDLRETAIAIAQDAGRAIMQVYADGFDVQIKDDSSPVTSADLAANQVIEQGLQQLTPDLNEPVRPDDVIYVRESLF